MTDIPLFFTTTLRGKHSDDVALVDMRQQMRGLCWNRWCWEGLERMYYVEPQDESIPFQLERRKKAEALARSMKDEFYILADDDCLIKGMDLITDKALEMLKKYKDFGSLSLWPAGTEGPLMPQPGPGDPHYYLGTEIEEVNSNGGIRFMRVGCVDNWPEPTNEYQYDMQHAEAMRASGWRVGYIKEIQMIHVGAGYSLSWP